MKKFMKIGALSLALIASLLLLSNSTNAASVGGDVSLDITTVTGSCTYGTSLYIGTHPAQYATYNMTWSEFPGEFNCVDTEGLATFTMTMQATTDLSNGTVAQDIPAANVSMIVNPNRVSAGYCVAGTNQTTWASIGATPATILNKASQLLDICTVSATGVNLAVVIPASQAIGTYTGTLSLVMPF